MAELTHCPVLLEECIQGLDIKPEGIYIDGTLGRAGHSREIAKRLTTGRLICIDRDQAALDAAQTRMAEYLDHVTLVHSNFTEIPQVLDQLGIPQVDGVLLDLGVSSPQLDDPARGFSYMHDAPLDMRMDPATLEPGNFSWPTTGETAASNCISPSMASSGASFWASIVASWLSWTVPPLPEPLVEKDSMATLGSMPKNSAVLAVSTATSASFWAAVKVTLPSLSTESS